MNCAHVQARGLADPVGRPNCSPGLGGSGRSASTSRQCGSLDPSRLIRCTTVLSPFCRAMVQMFLTAAYVGNRGIHLPSGLNPINQPNPSILSYGSLLSQPVNSPAAMAAEKVVFREVVSEGLAIEDLTFGEVTGEGSAIINRQGQATFRIEF